MHQPPPIWIEDWQKGTLDLNQEAIDWLQSRPQTIKELMLKFPPSCLVKANRPLHCPGVGEIGIVSSYYEPDEIDPNGLIGVRASPDGDVKPQWLEVVGYYKGLTPKILKEIFTPNSILMIREFSKEIA